MLETASENYSDLGAKALDDHFNQKTAENLIALAISAERPLSIEFEAQDSWGNYEVTRRLRVTTSSEG